MRRFQSDNRNHRGIGHRARGAILRTSAVGWILATGIVGAALEAQAGAEDATSFLERIDVQIVNVDVVATDKRGVFVAGLTIDDFRLEVDGQEVPITNFYSSISEQVAFAEVRGVEPGSSAPEGTPVRPLPRTTAVFVDHDSIHPSSRKKMLTDLREYLRSEGVPGSQMILFSLHGNVGIRARPTASVDELLFAVEDLTKEASGGAFRASEFLAAAREVSWEVDGDSAMAVAELHASRVLERDLRTLEGIGSAIDYLGPLRGPKALVYLGGGVTERPGAGLMDYLLRRFPSTDTRGAGSRVALDVGTNGAPATAPPVNIYGDQMVSALDRLANRANNQRVTLYSITASDGPRWTNPSAGNTDVDGTQIVTPNSITLERAAQRAAMNRMTRPTGGSSSTYLTGILESIDNDFDNFYSLAFMPQQPGALNRAKDIKVEVVRPGIEVRYRRNYRPLSRRERLSNHVRSALAFGDAPNPLNVRVEKGESQIAGKKRVRQPLLVKVPMERVTLLPKDDVHEGELFIFLGVEDERGRTAPVSVKMLPIRIPNEQLDAALAQDAGYPLAIDLNALGHKIAVTIHDRYGGVTSTALVSVPAPS